MARPPVKIAVRPTAIRSKRRRSVVRDEHRAGGPASRQPRAHVALQAGVGQARLRPTDLSRPTASTNANCWKGGKLDPVQIILGPRTDAAGIHRQDLVDNEPVAERPDRAEPEWPVPTS